MAIFNQQALDELKRCKEQIETEVPIDALNNVWLGSSPFQWFSKFNTGWEISDLSKTPLNRLELLELIKLSRNKNKLDPSILRKLIVSVFAWGGMGYSGKSGKRAIDTIGAYEEVCSKLLNGMPPVNAYAEFYKLKKSKKMQGVGPAYYTKLIFFFGDQTGLIMDQWTARSTNLLLGKKIIKMQSRTHVTDNNSEQIYKSYLEFVSELQNHLSIRTLPETEELIFSCSHKKWVGNEMFKQYHPQCSAWRKFVAENG